MPPNGEVHENWISAIENKQKFDHNSIRYLICELHFDTESLAGVKCRKDLKPDVVPSIFPSSEKPIEIPDQNLSGVDVVTVDEPDQNMNRTFIG